MMDAFKKALKDKQGDNFAIIVAKLDGDQLKELGVNDQAPMAADHKEQAQAAPEMPEEEGMEGAESEEMAEGESSLAGPPNMPGVVQNELMAKADQGGLAAKIKDMIKAKMKK